VGLGAEARVDAVVEDKDGSSVIEATRLFGSDPQFDIKFEEGESPADIEIALSGVPTPASFISLNVRLMQDPRFRAGLTMLVDLSGLDGAALAEDGVQGFAEMVVERDWYRMPSAVAIIATDPHTRDAALLYRAHLGGSRSSREVFRSRAEALAWLEELSQR